MEERAERIGRFLHFSFSFSIRSRIFWRSEILSTRSRRETILENYAPCDCGSNVTRFALIGAVEREIQPSKDCHLHTLLNALFGTRLLLLCRNLSGNKRVTGRSRPTNGSSASSGVEWYGGLLFPTLFDTSLTLQELQSDHTFARTCRPF
jgi:hypothetical protein